MTEETTTATAIAQTNIPGINALLIGGTGTGKTYSIRTLVDAGLEVFILFTEPGMETLMDIPSDKLHWHYIPPAAPDWADMIDSAKKINTLNLKMLAEMGDINKRKYAQFIEVLTALSDFPDDRTGKKFGGVDSWNGDRVIVVDSLSGLAIMAMNLVTGSKPVKSMADWGMAMDNLERLTTKLCVDTKCHFVLIAHAEREKDEITGGETLMASTLGKKLGPKLPRFFSEVIHVKRAEKKFTWSTATYNFDLKTRYLSISDEIVPSFAPIIAKWRAFRDAHEASVVETKA